MTSLLASGACGGQLAPGAPVGDDQDATADVQSRDDGGSDARIAEAGEDADAQDDVTGDAGDAGPCVDPGPSWTPNELPGLVLWLDSTSGVSTTAGAVGGWSDRSPAHNDAAQGDPTLRPTLALNVIGSLPAVRFDGVSTMLTIADAASLHWGTDDYALAVLARFSTTRGTTNQMLFHRAMLAAPWYGAEIYVNSEKPTLAPRFSFQSSEFAYATSSRSGLDDGAFHVFAGRRLGTTLEARVDAVADGFATVSPVDDVSDVGSPVSIGHNYDSAPGFEALEGDIVAIVAVHASLDDAQMGALECRLLGLSGQ